jgi:hypothetical protein
MTSTPPPIEEGVQEWALESWTQFYDFIATHFEDKPAYIFRGQGDAQWKVKSTLDRLEDKHPTHRLRIDDRLECLSAPPVLREEHLRAFRQATRGRPGVAPPPADDNECWAFGQHHGLATPMLDWTLSPFVALFFAFEEENDAKQRAVFALSASVIREKHSPDDPAPIPFLPANEVSYRLLVQAGLFLKMPRKTELEDYVRSHFGEDTERWSQDPRARPVLVKILIANNEGHRAACLKTLNKMNINRMTLFPDLDGAAKYINALWEIDFDTSLGYIGNDPANEITRLTAEVRSLREAIARIPRPDIEENHT